MEDLFSNSYGIPAELMCKIFCSLGPNDISKLPYVSYNWYKTCRRCYFIEEHCSQSKKNNVRHMFFCMPKLQDHALPLFLQIDPLDDDEDAHGSFTRQPSFFSGFKHTLVDVDEGVLCFRNNMGKTTDRFHLWNPVTYQIVEIYIPNGIANRMSLRCGFGFDQNNDGFCIVVMWDTFVEENPTSMIIYSSYSRTWYDGPPPIYTASFLFDKSVHMNGYIYWLSCMRDKCYDDCHVMIEFNFHNKSFKISKFLFTVRDSK
ncbi:F-box protein CPR30-like [Senna tora]|uniref:F-box protein CPR30-like n=1 Tax=Senna tora TaxID=362788 RepID=A0A834X1A0_9FABA|nr:F-box protein CPR30-like [Senna tora]